MKRTTLWLLLTFAVPPLIYLGNGCTFTPGTFGDLPPEESNPNSYSCSCDCGPETRTRSNRIATGIDDAEEVTTDGTMARGSSDVDLRSQRIAGLRFANVGIPVGATIVAANVQFTAAANSTGTVTVSIRGEAAANSAAFSANAFDLSTRALLPAAVSWPIDPWTLGDAGAAQLTPDITDVIQEIVDQAGWADTNALTLLFFHTSGTGVRLAQAYNARPDQAAQLIVTYTDPSAPNATRTVQACMLAAHNPNLGGTFDEEALEADCILRVQDTLSGLAGACGYPSACTCAAVPDTARFAESCDAECTEVELDGTCSNFDPIDGQTQATNLDGDPPVCVVDGPLTSVAFSRRTMCDVTGTVDIDVEEESVSPAASGIVEFTGFCPGESCAVGIDYQLDLADVTVGNFFKSATFTNLASLGGSVAGGEALLSETGDGTFAPDSTDSSGRGERGTEQKAFVGSNGDSIGVTATFGATDPTCSLNGALVGSADPELKRCEGFGPSAGIECESDDECEDVAECSDEVCNCEVVSTVDMTMTMTLTGDIVNQPPTAAPKDLTVECNQPTGSRLTLDGTESSDFENNIVLYSWLLGDRAGDEVGFEPLTQVEQAVGTQSYVLRVIDAYAQTDEATAEVTVEDTEPPVLACNSLATVTPPQIPISFTATATDVCDPNVVPTITARDCFTFNSKGKKVDKTSSCKVTFAGDTVTIAHSGGVGTTITWDVTVTDAGGNTTTQTCSVLAVRQ